MIVCTAAADPRARAINPRAPPGKTQRPRRSARSQDSRAWLAPVKQESDAAHEHQHRDRRFGAPGFARCDRDRDTESTEPEQEQREYEIFVAGVRCFIRFARLGRYSVGAVHGEPRGTRHLPPDALRTPQRPEQMASTIEGVRTSRLPGTATRRRSRPISREAPHSAWCEADRECSLHDPGAWRASPRGDGHAAFTRLRIRRELRWTNTQSRASWTARIVHAPWSVVRNATAA